MTGLLAAFFSSFLSTLLIVHFKHLHQEFTSDFDFSGPQKFHAELIPRIGGISIAIGIFFAVTIKMKEQSINNDAILILLCAIPTFSVGLAEDITKKISASIRLIITTFSALLAVFLLNIQITNLGHDYLNVILSIPMAGALLSIFAITGLANAYNIIDGFNGLSSMIGIISLLAIAYVGFSVADLAIVYLALTMAVTILGFFILNYPRGLIFLGDGGAYLIGFWIAVLSILIVTRHKDISPWFALLVNAYPTVETIFTIYRRKIIHRRNIGSPDADHLHTMIYKKLARLNQKDRIIMHSENYKTAPFLWALSILSVVPSLFLYRSSHFLAVIFAGFIAIYIYTYHKISCQLKTVTE